MVNALESAETNVNEPECANQMKSIVAAMHLPYSSLIGEPETLLRCSTGMASANGSLWTRFTVQYNLYAGSIVAMGTDEQRAQLVASQAKGALGCFAFTEKGAGVMSGAGMETTATYDSSKDTFVIHSPTPSSAKNWISQGCYAENAVILADLMIDGKSYGGHLFWSPIAKAATGRGANALSPPKALPGVVVTSLPQKTSMPGLDNAEITFDHFHVPRTSLLGRYGAPVMTEEGRLAYVANLPKGTKRMLDILVSRLMTGRIVLSEATCSFAMARVRHSWDYCLRRELWRGRKDKGPTMAEMPLVRGAFRDYGRVTSMYQHFLAVTREQVAEAIRTQHFAHEVVEAACMCKFLGTGWGVDAMSAMRKTMGAQGFLENSRLGHESFLPYATSAAEGDNTIMELKVVQDIVRGRTAKLPLALMATVMCCQAGRRAICFYLERFARAMVLHKAAMRDGQLLRDIAWARAHMRVIAVWLASYSGDADRMSWLESYSRIAMKFPVPLQA